MMLQVIVCLWLLTSWPAQFLYDADQEITMIDFGSRKGWHTKGGINVRSDGRVYLTEDGRGVIWKTVEVDVDAFPLMLVRISDSITREKWMIAVEKSETPSFDENKWIRLIERYAEEGGFMVPLKKITGWNGKVQFVLMIIVEGHSRDWVEFDALEAVRLTNAIPTPPKLSVPANQSVINPLALHYTWYQAANAVEYELQISGKQDFSEMKSIRVSPPYLADKLPYLPSDEELLPSGKWFWRVRAFNIVGQPSNWSGTGAFIVGEAVRPQPPTLSISADHPLIILFGDNRHLTENWKAVPDELKPYVVFRIEELPSESFQPLLQTAQDNNIPIIVQASGPHDYYGRVSSRISLPEIEHFFLKFPVVKGVYICEQAFRVSPANNRIMMNYAERLIPLAAQYGKIILWADGHWGRNLWIDVGLNKKLLDTIRAYKQYFVPLWKMNGAQTTYSAHDAILGFWTSGAVDHWGVQPERWYWYEAGFGKINEQFWFKEGTMENFPQSFYGQMVLLGLSSGASVYSFEPGGDIWNANGSLSQISQQVTFPLISEIIGHRWIPRREQVLREIHSVYVADSSDMHWSMDYGAMRVLYDGTYGIRHPFQMIPSVSGYRRIPILPKWTAPEVLNTFLDQLHGYEFSSSGEARKYIDKKYVSHDKGNAWIVHLNAGVIIMNSSENWDVDQTFEIPMNGKIATISGRISINSYLIAQQAQYGLHIHLNGRAQKGLNLELSMSERPKQIVVKPDRALAKSSWDPINHRLMLEFLFPGEVVNTEIRF